MAINNVNYNRAALTASKGMSAGSIAKAMSNGQLRSSIEFCILDNSGTTANLGAKLPKDAIVLGFIVCAEDLATACNLSIGDANDADLYLPATAIDNVNSFFPVQDPTFTGGTSSEDYAVSVSVGLGYRIGTNDGDDQLIATFSDNGSDGEKVTIVTIFAV